MLTRLLAALALCVALATTSLTGTPAYAEAGCEGASWGVACGVGVPGYGGSGGTAPLKHTGSGSSDPVACVTQEMPPREVPCSNPELGTWSNARACYVKAESPPPPLTDAVWSGNTTGSIYRCSSSGIWSGPGSYLFWADSAPGVIPDPRVLALQAVTQMRLRAVEIGMAPDPSPGSVALVGLPIWLWVASPDQSTWGPNTKTASAGGYSVTATGKVT